jgi:nucleoside-diphosphate-sugar epimerase
MIKKIAVITGATSKVMDQLIDTLITNNFHIIAVSRKEKKEETRKNIKWIVCDLSFSDQDFSFLKDSDIIFHAASVSNYYKQKKYLLNNFQSTINLTDAAKKYGISRIVYISSILAGYNLGDYGLSKIKSEEYITQNFNNWLIIRPSQLYGYSLDNPIEKLIETVRNKRIVFCPVSIKKNIYPLYFSDLVNFIFESSIEKNESKIFKVLTGPKAYNYRTLIDEVALNSNMKPLIIPIPKIFIISLYYLIRAFNIRIGIYPDLLYRFYYNPSIEISSDNTILFSDFLKDNIKRNTID